MNDIQDLNGVRLKQKATHLLESFKTKKQKYEIGCAFLLLSKWDRDGFDAKAIETLSTPEDIQYHYVLGKVYRAPMLSVAEEGTRGFKRGDDMRGSSDDLKTMLNICSKTLKCLELLMRQENGPER